VGLPNRRLFDDRFAHARSLAERQGHGLAVVVLDLDGFKALNDTRGHAAGDEVLRGVAAALISACRDSDTVARIGGDEFAVLCEGLDAAEHAPALAERLRSALDRRCDHPPVVGHLWAVTAAGCERGGMR
jgi:diguanylate cyclase (GGDEF)-like protein